MQHHENFHRPELAKHLADYLNSEDGSSGLFISSKHGTGKSTFIREDLIPVLEAHYGTHVVYVDLWEDRTEPLRAIFRQLALNLELTQQNIDEVFELTVERALATEKENFFHHVNGLGPLDAAVLKVMARDGKRFAPYTKASFVDYKTFVLAVTGEIPLDVNQSSVQQALERLRAEKLIWRAGRGAYFIEDPQQAVWLNEQTQSQEQRLQDLRMMVLAEAAA